MKKIAIACCLVIVAMRTEVLAQTRTIEGRVTAFNTYALEDIEVVARKSKASTRTDADGRFCLPVKSKDLIRISDPAFMPFERRVKTEKSLEINLIYDDTEKNKKRVINGGYLSAEDLEYGLQYLNKDNSLYSLFTDVYEAIEYAIPEAATVDNPDGSRGFILRGPTSFSGDNNALYLVNGSIVDDIDFIAPANIKNITKLTNAEASMFGSRGAKGVISIALYP